MRVNSGEWKDRLLEELKTYKPYQLEKAAELIKNKLVGMHMDDYVFVSSDDSLVYLTSVWKQSCTCAAGHFEVPCYHLCAANAMTVYGKTEAPKQL